MVRLRNNPIILSLLLITFFSALAYIPLIPFLGFYSDDFFFGYVAHFYGISGIMQSLIIDRPFNGYLLAFNYFLLGLGDKVFLWHIYNFFIRLIGGYALFFSLKKIWPGKLYVITSITLLFLIYPGFLQQTLPLGFGGWTTNLTLWVISLAFTVSAIYQSNRIKSLFFTLIAIFLQINSFLQLEFFIGMEALRLLMITFVLRNRITLVAVKKTLIYWSPYIISLVIFVLWRVLVFKSTRQETDINWVFETYYSNPLWIAKIPLEILHSFIQTVIFAYFIPPVINFIRLPLQNSLVSISLGIFSGTLLYFYFKKIQDGGSDRKIGRQLFIIGLFSILAALIPEILSGRYVRMFNVFDRYTITSIIATAFIIVGFLLFKFTRKASKWIMIFLVVISVTSHMMNAYWHKIMWDKQTNLWWQLYWRAPSIKENAMLIFDFQPVSENALFRDLINNVKWYRYYWVDYQIWAPGNLFFNYGNSPKVHLSGDFLEDSGVVDKIRNRVVESITDRNMTHTKDFRNTVIISTPSDTSCLWVLDKKRNEFPLRSSGSLKSTVSYSDVDKLTGKGSSIVPPKEIFGSEPEHAWCYFFQKASLARQLKDWDKLEKLKKEVMEKNLKPNDPNEWLPFTKDSHTVLYDKIRKLK